MTGRRYTDDELAMLRDMPKTVTNPGVRWLTKPGNRQRIFLAEGEGGVRFSIYQRQNIKQVNSFSCGIELIEDDGTRLMLARYNGPSHPHGDIAFRPHIHRATERAMAMGRQPESEAEETDRFTSCEGALACLIADFRLSGVSAAPDQTRGLFT